MPACAQCRQRKVRCRGGPSRCDPCARLDFQCSMANMSPSSACLSEGTNTSAPRRRIGRACDACHARRARCSGDTPSCTRCQQEKLSCQYSLSLRQYRVKERRKRQGDFATEHSSQSGTDVADRSTPATANECVVSPSSSVRNDMDEVLDCEKTLVRQLIGVFFEYIYPVPVFSFLHRADFLSQYSTGTISPVLLLAVCGAAARFVPSFMGSSTRPKSWVDRAEAMVFQNLGKVDISYLQALAILGFNRAGNHQTGKSFHFVPLMVRMAYLLKLHKEDTKLPLVERECRRRLLWSIFTSDRFYAGGVKEYVLLPTSLIYVQLPCREHHFELDTPVETPLLRDPFNLHSEPSLSACILRVLDIRNRVLQYTKFLLETSSSPEQSLTRFQAFEKELHDVYHSLPSEFLFSTRTFQLHAYSPARTPFISLHLYWHHCNCELYRVLNPGYREALPNSVIQATSPELVAYAQSSCLQHAVSVGEIIASTHKVVENGPYISDNAQFVCLYQASCAILYACHRDSPSYVMDPEAARRYFTAFIDTLTRSLRYFPRFSIYVQDIQNMLRSIDDPSSPLPVQKASAEVDFRARPLPDESSDGEPSTTHTSEPHHSGSAGAIQDATRALHAAPSAAAPISDPANQLPSLHNQHDLSTPIGNHDFLWPYLGATEYGAEPGSDPNQGLLWDWADALSSNFT